MGEYDRVDLADVCAQRLRPKISTGIDNERRLRSLDVNGGT
jgi:hypothetical protein